MTDVIVYSTPTCPWCMRVKEFLKKNDIAFKDLDVGADPKARAEMVEKTGQLGVPVVQIDSDIIIGFDEDKIKELLKI